VVSDSTTQSSRGFNHFDVILNKTYKGNTINIIKNTIPQHYCNRIKLELRFLYLIGVSLILRKTSFWKNKDNKRFEKKKTNSQQGIIAVFSAK
jgi:hypothetical protein